MALTDTFLRFAKASKPSGDKHYGGGLYIYVKPQGKYRPELHTTPPYMTSSFSAYVI
jgi:hypothetical protein